MEIFKLENARTLGSREQALPNNDAKCSPIFPNGLKQAYRSTRERVRSLGETRMLSSGLEDL